MSGDGVRARRPAAVDPARPRRRPRPPARRADCAEASMRGPAAGGGAAHLRNHHNCHHHNHHSHNRISRPPSPPPPPAARAVFWGTVRVMPGSAHPRDASAEISESFPSHFRVISKSFPSVTTPGPRGGGAVRRSFSLPAPAPRPRCRPRSHDASEPPDVYNVGIRALTRGWRASTRRRCTCPASTPARSTAARAAPSPTTAASCPPAPTGGSGRRSGLQSGMERSPTRGQGGTARHFQPRAVPVARRGNCSWPPH